MILHPVTRAQQRLLVQYALEPGYVARMSTARGWRFPRQAVDLGTLAAALDRVVERHDALRAVFAVEPRPHAVVRDRLRVEPEAHHTSSDAEAAAWIGARANLPFDITAGPLLRCHVATTDDAALVALVAHHLICDGRTLSILVEELAAACGDPAAAAAPTPGAQFHDIARAEERAATHPGNAALIDTWRRELADLETLDLPTDFPRPAQPSGNGAVSRTRLPPGTCARLHDLAADGLTPFAAGLAAFAVLCSRYTGATDVPVGYPVANRSWPGSWRTVGYLANTAVARIRVDGSQSFHALAHSCRAAVLDVIDRDHVPFDAVVAAVRPDRSSAFNPLYQVTFATETAQHLVLGGAAGQTIRIDRDIRVLDLSTTLVRDGSGFEVVWHYDTELFEAATVEAMARSYTTLLDQLTAAPHDPVRSSTGLHADDLARLMTWSGQHRVAPPPRTTIVGQFARVAATRPSATAIVDGGLRLTYRELDTWSDALASHLVARGVCPGDIVGVAESRSHRFPVAALGILKAGAAYLPLDPSYPSPLLHLMVRDAAARFVVTSLDVELPDVEMIPLGERPTNEAATPGPTRQPTGDDGAYVIYTSGSTGTPKGVMIPHSALMAALDMWREYYRLPEGGRFPMFSSSSFDQSVGELTRALCQGGELHICPPGELRDPDALVEYLRRADPYMLDCVPAVLRVAADSPNFDEALASMSTRVLTLGGERWSRAEALRFRRGLPDAQLSNVYGLTECTVDSTGWRVDPDHPGPGMPIGTPLRNTAVFLLDAEGRLTPPGAVGGLHIGGSSLAWGYLNRPALTAEHFTPSPFGPPGDRLYHTGDRARFRADGTLEFLGRADWQVKIRGFRVEIGEVEAALGACAGVTDVHVAVAPGPRGDSMLLAYIAADGDIDLTPARRRLPAHMVPARVVRVARLPRMANGKIDSAALPAAGAEQPPAASDTVADLLTRQVARAWSAVLAVPVDDPGSSFFLDLGGTSLLAVQAVTEARRATGRRVPFAALFDNPTLGAFAEACRAAPALEPSRVQDEGGRT